MARAYTVYANSETTRWQNSLGEALDPARLKFLLGETLTLTVYIRDNSNAAVDLTGNTTGWNLTIKDPSDLDGTTLLASVAGVVTTAASGIVVFTLVTSDLNSTALATYLADPMGAPGYGKPVAVSVYTMPASDMTVYGAGTGTAARTSYRPGDPVTLSQSTLALEFGNGSDGALAYTAGAGWTLAGATMTTSSGNWTVSGATLTIHRSLQCTTGAIASGGILQSGADNTAQWPTLYFTGMFTPALGSVVRAHLVGIDTSGTVMATPGAARSTTGTGNAPSPHNGSVQTLSPAGGSASGGGTASNIGGSRHNGYGNLFYHAIRVAGGVTTAGSTGAGSNGQDRAISSSAYSSDPDSYPLLPGGPGSGGGGGAATLGTGTATSGAGGAGGRGGGILQIRARGISNAGTIHADGEAGSNGTAATSTGNGQGGGGGGGSGGGGGLVLLWYGDLGYANTGTVRATAGAPGTGGAGSDAGAPSASYNGGNGGASVDGWVASKQVAV